MSKKVIIHVGPHKTGTTSIQKMLYDTSLSEDATFIYPFTDPEHLGHHDLAETILRSDARKLAELSSKIRSTDKACVLSSEEFCYLPPSALKTFGAYLQPADVSIVYYVRDFLTSLHPWWQEQVKHGGTQTFLEFALGCLAQPHSLHLLIPDVMLTNWASAFGRDSINIFRYDAIPDVARQFADDVLDLALPLDSFTAVNKSYTYIETEMVRFWNRSGVRGEDLIQSPNVGGLSADIVTEARDFIKNFSLSYAMPSFAAIEEILLTRWRDRIGGSFGQYLFETRERTYPYVHPDFWVVRSDLAERMRAFASGWPPKSR